SRLDRLLEGRGALGKAGLAAAARLLVHQLTDVFYFPPARFYELAGLSDGAGWRRLALGNPQRQRFVRQCLAPTVRLIKNCGLLK
ncbi:MAG TPA: hypothetical protein VFP00_11890, partial [Burkholderiales bacterium]|nr:hypothetical protein [Burkholderiales bacterium]